MVLKEPTVDYLVKHGGIEFIHPKIAENVINEFVPVNRMISPEALIEYSYDVYQAMWNHKSFMLSSTISTCGLEQNLFVLICM